MVHQLPIVELLGKKWFVDERLNEFRSVVKIGEPIIFFSREEMDNMLSIKEIIDNHTMFDIDNETLSKLRNLFDDAVKGNNDAIKEIAKICKYEDNKNT